MLLHVSEERRVVHAGYVAEWCPRCADAEPFAIERQEHRTKWLGLVPLTGWKKRSEHGLCSACKVKLFLDSGAYPQLSGVPMRMPDLIRHTHPSLADLLRTRQECIERARSGRLTPVEREGAVARALAWCGKAVEPITRSQRVGRFIGWSLLAMVAGGLMVIPVGVYLDSHVRTIPTQRHEQILWTCWLVFSLLTGMAIWCLGRALTPWRRRSMYVWAGRAVATMNPTHEEIHCAVLAERARGNPLCRGAHPALIARRVTRASEVDPFAVAALSQAA